MARLVVFVPDLLFGSQVQGALRAAGHEVGLVADEVSVRDALPGAGGLIVDLTNEAERRACLLDALARAGLLDGVSTLAFYAHVEADTRALAERAGFDLVIPRSRMAREAVALIARLTGTG